MSITLSGIGSGLDVTSIINAIIGGEDEPVKNQINRSISQQNVQISALGGMKSALADFQSALGAIGKSEGLVGQSMNINGEMPGLTVNQTDEVAPGNYTLKVYYAARAQKNTSWGYTPGANIGSGTMVVTKKDGSTFNVNVSGSLDDVAASFNAVSADTGVTARVIHGANAGNEDKLVYEGLSTGADNTFTVSQAAGTTAFNGITTAKMTQVSSASNLKVQFDGLYTERPTNDLSTVVPGLDIQVTKQSEGSMVAIEVAKSAAPVKDQMKNFVEAYNKLMDVFDKYAGAGQDGERTPLEMNSMISTLKRQIRSVVSDTINVDGQNFSLAQMGVMTVAKTGKLEIKDSVMDDFLSTYTDKISEFFNQTGGLIEKFDSVIQPSTQVSGIFDTSINSARSRISDLNERMDNHSVRMARLENTLVAKYAAMDSIMQRMNAQNSAITNMMSVIMNNSKK